LAAGILLAAMNIPQAGLRKDCGNAGHNRALHLLIIDWELFKEEVPADTRLVRPAVERAERSDWGPMNADEYRTERLMRGTQQRVVLQLCNRRQLYSMIV
jgi:hypothetical protein